MIKGVAHHDDEDETIEEWKNNGEPPFYGDMLETILSHVPLVDLVPASRVSKSWDQATISSLNNFNKPKPWLIIHSQSTRAPYTITTHGYDPRSHLWIEASQPSIKNLSTLRSSTSNFLYMITLKHFSFSRNLLYPTWQHVDAPHVSRINPIVAFVNDSIVVAGGTCEFEDDKLCVEIYNMASQVWVTCESMPTTYKESAAATWLSTIVVQDHLVVMEKSTGVTHTFDPKQCTWSQRYHTRPDPKIFYSVLAHSGGRVIVLIGLIGTCEKIEGVKIYKVKIEDGNIICNEEIGEMPIEMILKIRSELYGFTEINVCMAGDFIYVYNSTSVYEVVVGEMVEDGAWRWWSLAYAASSDRNMIMQRNVIGCVEVGLDELRGVMNRKKGGFEVM